MTTLFFVFGEKLSLHLNTTKCMLFGKSYIDEQVQTMIYNVNVERVYENKFLDLILIHKICWKPRISYQNNVGKVLNSEADKTHTGLFSQLTVLIVLYCIFHSYHHCWITMWKCEAALTKATYNQYAYFKREHSG